MKKETFWKMASTLAMILLLVAFHVNSNTIDEQGRIIEEQENDIEVLLEANKELADEEVRFLMRLWNWMMRFGI